MSKAKQLMELATQDIIAECANEKNIGITEAMNIFYGSEFCTTTAVCPGIWRMSPTCKLSPVVKYLLSYNMSKSPVFVNAPSSLSVFMPVLT